MRLVLSVCTVVLAFAIATGFANASSKAPLLHGAVHPNAIIEREFALTALQHLEGPVQRPFLDLLNKLSPAQQIGVTISSKATKNMSCSGGVCTPTAAVAILNVTQLTNMLVDESVTVGTSAQAPDIFVNAPFSWTGGNDLTLQAIGNIVVNKPVSDSGPAPLNLTYNANGAGGALSFGAKGHISFASTGNALTINGQGYILANNIQTLAQLIARNPSGSFALSANYNARHDGKYTQSPIQTTFQGNFEGLGNAISNLVVEDQNTNEQDVGFFEQTGASGTIANLNVTYLTVTVAGAKFVGGLVAYNRGTISGSSTNGTVSAANTTGCDGYVGGLAGVDDGTISFSHAGGSVTADGTYCYIGGLVGQVALAAPGEIDHSYATTSVSGSGGSIGGLAGVVGWSDGTQAGAFAGTVVNTYATGAVTATNTQGVAMGGLIGDLINGSATNSTAEGAVTADGPADLGGAVGEVSPFSYSSASVDDLIADGAVSDSGYCGRCGGAVGGADNLNGPASVAESVSYGTVTGGYSSPVGGFIGADDTGGGMSDDGWDMTTSGITDPSQGAGNIPNDPGITGFN